MLYMVQEFNPFNIIQNFSNIMLKLLVLMILLTILGDICWLKGYWDSLDIQIWITNLTLKYKKVGTCWKPGWSKAFTEAKLKDKENITSVSFPRARLGKVWCGAWTRSLKIQNEDTGYPVIVSGRWLSVLSQFCLMYYKLFLPNCPIYLYSHLGIFSLENTEWCHLVNLLGLSY